MNKLNVYRSCAAAVFSVSMVVGSSAYADTVQAGDYFIRPFIGIGGGELIDGFQQNGATQGFQNFTTDFEAEVDLNDGSVKPYVFLPGSGLSGRAGGSFGETIEFENSGGQSVEFGFSVEGTIDVSEVLEGPLPTGYSMFVFANLFVFEAEAGADFNNFNTLEGALISQSFVADFGTAKDGSPVDNAFEVFENLSGSIEVEDGQRYEVFASLALGAATNGNDISIEMDFTNTGLFDINAPQGVSYLSASGVFLDSTGTLDDTAIIPLPASAWFLISALGIGAGVSRRRSKAV